MAPAQKLKLVFFVPRASTQPVLRHLFARFPNHVGRIGAYAGCAFVSPGTGPPPVPLPSCELKLISDWRVAEPPTPRGATLGQFLPLEGANPAIGEVGRPEHVEEDRVEVLVLGARNSQDPGGHGQGQGSEGTHGGSDADADVRNGVEMAAVLEELKKVRVRVGSSSLWDWRTRWRAICICRSIRTRRLRMMCTGWRTCRGWCNAMRFSKLLEEVQRLVGGSCGMFQVLDLIVCGEFSSPSIFLRVLWSGAISGSVVILRVADGAPSCILPVGVQHPTDALLAVNPELARARS